MMLKRIDSFLNRITMYRLVFYELLFLLAIAAVFSVLGILPYSATGILFSVLVLTAASWLTNIVAAKFLKIPPNSESVYITAFILALIITPPSAGGFVAALPFLIAAAFLSEASKYIINIKGKHIFNPAAVAVVITSFAIGQSASWWVGSTWMFLPVLLGGLLVVKKVQRFDAVFGFLATAIVSLVFFKGWAVLPNIFLSSPLVFLTTIMLTEPLTMPPTRDGRIAYGMLVGWMFSPQLHLGSFYLTPEIALLIGNIFSYLVSPKGRSRFELVRKYQAGQGVYDFVLRSDRRFAYKPGQYMEWTLGLPKSDSRGNRRYLTIASSPTEHETLLGVKFYENPSAFKTHLARMRPGDKIIGGQLAGDFVLPDNKNKKIVFVAGGIGITPFRSMLKYMVDRGQKRPVVMLYSNRNYEEIVYTDVLEEARQKLGVKTVYTLTDKKSIPEGWPGYAGYFNAEIISREVPDYRERTFYISGSGTMVDGFKETLLGMGVSRRKIRTDFFPGLA